MAHKNREKRAAKRAREAAETRELYDEEYEEDDDDDDYDYEYDARSRRRGPHPAVVALIVTAVVIIAGFYGLKTVYERSVEPINPDDTRTITVDIPKDSTTADIATILRDRGLIRNEYFFRLHCQRKGYDQQFKYGEYTLSKSMSVDEIADVIIKGVVLADTKKFTIPEGYTIKQVARMLAEKGIVSEAEFFDVVQNGDFDYAFLDGCPPGPERLEGFLYPETYEVYTDATANDIVSKMLAQFNALFKPEYYKKAEEMRMSILEIVTMGSLVEREALIPEERPVMAGVFYNRLELGMTLGCDSTIQYILGEQKEFLTYADTEIDSPYNTYMYTGLPPGPICSPRMASIEAALYPDNNDFVYFVLSAVLDGTHRFSEDYNEFLRNKDAYYEAVENAKTEDG